MLAEFLSRSGYNVRVTFDGPAALAIARQLAPDVAILDIGLPVMDGYLVKPVAFETLRQTIEELIAR